MVYVQSVGQGGLGKVSLYKAKNGTHYAVKEMLNKWDEHHYQRFVREVKLMSNLVHKGIIKVINYDVHCDNPYYVMPYYKDGSLRDRLEEMRVNGKVFAPKAASSLIFVAANALSFAHKNGAIHRDIKPENILFDGKSPIIADWGIGKFIHKESKVLTGSGPLGTPSYCAPEQWENGRSDQRSDIYSLGLIYRELLTGSICGQVKDPKVKAIISRMTEQSPNDRYQSIDNVLRDIRSLHVVNENKPMDDFWEGLAVVSIFAGLAVILGAALDN